MKRIILFIAFLSSAVLCEEVARKPKLFFVSTSAISLDGMEPEGAVQPSSFKREVEGESVQLDEESSKVSRNREGRFLLYWITTTSISTSTSYTITYSVSSALCTPAGAAQCALLG